MQKWPIGLSKLLICLYIACVDVGFVLGATLSASVQPKQPVIHVQVALHFELIQWWIQGVH